MRIFIFFIAFTLLCLAGSAQAFYPATWDDLMFRLQKQVHLNRFKAEVTVQIFDPFAENTNPEKKSPPVELPAQAYQQAVYVKNGQVFIVETKDYQNELLHYYYENRNEILSHSVGNQRYFETIDVLPPGIRFMTSSAKMRDQVLTDAGITGREVAYHATEDNHVFLIIGDFDSGYYALLDPKSFHLHSLHNRIWKADGSWWDYEILFKKKKTIRKQKYTQVTEYYLNKKLFKRSTINRIRILNRIPIDKLKQKAQKFRYFNSANIEVDYAS